MAEVAEMQARVMLRIDSDLLKRARARTTLPPLPWGEGWGEGVWVFPGLETPSPSPLPEGEGTEGVSTHSGRWS
jgi:hypothetical protein